MAIEVACVKCKLPVTVDDETLKDLMEAGGRAQIAHSVCPTEAPEEQREFHVVINVYEVHRNGDGDATEEQVAGVGATVHAPSFRDAYEPLGLALGDEWGKIAKAVDFIDMPVAQAPQTKQDTIPVNEPEEGTTEA